MDEKTRKQMATMVDAVQPHCDETVIAAMTCSHAGSMKSVFLVKIFKWLWPVAHTSKLPNPVFIAVGKNTIYAFDYRPRGFKFKIKNEVARWPKNEVMVAHEETGMMARITLTTNSGETHPLEVPTFMGGKELVRLFLDALNS